MPLERDIEDKAVRKAKKLGWLVVKMAAPGARGWPDRLFISQEGVHVWIEFKVPGKVPTQLQSHRLSELRKRDCNAYWVDSVDACLEILGKFAV